MKVRGLMPRNQDIEGFVPTYNSATLLEYWPGGGGSISTPARHRDRSGDSKAKRKTSIRGQWV